ncbi:UFD1 protein, partial [Polypterus senegalus]
MLYSVRKSKTRCIMLGALEPFYGALSFSFNMFDHPLPRAFQSRFSTQYRCYSVSMLAGPNDRSDVEKGGKSRLNITYPMLFKLTNKNSDRMTHCGVLEFVADEGICYLPHWMMQNLLLEEGGLVQVESVNLMVATYSKFQPQSPDFLDITNPKAVLENALRNFACLTTGDVIAINYNEKEEEADHSSYADVDMGFRAFTGSGNRLDGKKKGIEPSPAPLDPSDIKRGIPNYEFKIGKITFIRNSRPQPKKLEDPPRPCDDYWSEFKHCRSFQHLFHSYYTFGSAPSCQQWKLDYYSCQEWEKHHSAQAKDALQASERKRVEEKQRYKPVWELRKKPPHDWYLPLQDERENKS